MAKDPYKYFRVEARDLIDQLAQGALEVEKAPTQAEHVGRLLRLAHTLKGAARVVRQVEIADLAHEIEDVLAPLRDAPGSAGRAHVDALFGRLDAISGRLAELTAAAPEAVPAGGPDAATRDVRADAVELDALMDGVSEARFKLTSLRRQLSGLEEASALAEALTARLRSRGGRDEGSLAAVALAPAAALALELRAGLGSLGRQAATSLDQLDRELRQVRAAAERLRMVPAKILFSVLERAARDAAAALGKQVRFEGVGGDVRLDAHIVGAVQAALVQLVRNAVAHGIERDRGGCGKVAEGCVRVTIARRGRRTAISCSDDGAGIDLEAVQRSARSKGRLGDNEDLPPETLLRLLMGGGVSTSGQVTSVSGRGVGLDIVRETAERLGGEVAVQTEAGVGTSVELLLPLSTTSLEAVLAEVDGLVIAVPFDAVRSVVRLEPTDLVRSGEGQATVIQGETVPYAPMASMLRRSPEKPVVGPRSAIVLERAGTRAVIGVDRPLGVATIVPHPLPDLAPPAPMALGVFLDEDGSPRLVLDAERLIEEATSARGYAPDSQADPSPLLIIDDSLTTRMLEQSILESAGYHVHAAKSAEEGLEAARRERYALFLVDVEMPGMDGFSFIEHVRRDPDLKGTPAILVTSRSSPEDRRRGEAVGAQGYVVKSEFDQAEFLSGVRRLVG